MITKELAQQALERLVELMRSDDDQVALSAATKVLDYAEPPTSIELYNGLLRRVTKALDMATNGSFDGGHHKMWVIDQIVRILAGDDYGEWVAEFCDGEDGPSTYEWDVGIPP